MEISVLLMIIVLIVVGLIQGISSLDIGNPRMKTKDTGADITQLLTRYRRQSMMLPNCGSQIVSSGDVISSPRFPLPYDSNRYCIWMIKVPASKVIHIKFQTMDITGRTGSCDANGDFLKIQDKDQTGRLLGLHCGNKLPRQMITPTNQVWITFQSDGDGTQAGKGFKLTFTAMDTPAFALGIHLTELQLETGIGNIGMNPVEPATTKTKTTERPVTEVNITNPLSTIKEDTGIGRALLNTEALAASTDIATSVMERSTMPSSLPTEGNTDPEQLQTSAGTVASETTVTSDLGRNADLDKFTRSPAIKSEKPEAVTNHQSDLTNKIPRFILPPTTQGSQDAEKAVPTAKPSSLTRCRVVLVEPSGNFTSPLYPQSYENNNICTWTITADPLEYIGLRFIDFDIDNPMPNGVCDTRYSYVRLSYFNSQGELASEQLCGSILPLDVTISYSNQMVVYFFSELGYGKGFAAEYDTFNPDLEIDGAPEFPKRHLRPGDEILYSLYSSYDWPVDPDDISDSCGNLIENSGTMFASPGYPVGYGVLSCLWIIVAKPGQDIKLELKHFNVGIHPEDDTCDNSPALVEVSYYDPSGHLMSKELCGAIESSTVITSMSVQMYVSFTSSQAGQKGFQAEVIFFDAETVSDGSVKPYEFYDMKNVATPSPDSNFCQQMDTGCCYDLSKGLPYGTIVSPGYPDGYGQYLNCKWVIQGDSHQSIFLHFNDFQLDSAVEENEDCSFAKSLVRVIYFDENHRMHEQFLCGHSQPVTIESDFHTLYVEFYTFADPKSVDRGFKAVYLKDEKAYGDSEDSSVAFGGDVFRGLLPFIPLGNVLNGTLVLPENSLPNVTDVEKEPPEDDVTLRPGITKRPRITKRKKPIVEILTEPPWSELEDVTVAWSASLNYDSIDLEEPELPTTESNLDEESSGDAPVTPNVDDQSQKMSTEDAQNLTQNGTAGLIDIGGRFISVPVIERPPPDSPKRSTPTPSAVTPSSTEVLNTSDVSSGRNMTSNFMRVNLPSGETSTTAQVQLGSRPEGKTTMVDGNTKGSARTDNQTRVVTFICASIGSALLLILFIVLVYYACAKRRASDSMDLAKERTNYWQSYQAFDAPEWAGQNRGTGNDRVQQEPPQGVVYEGSRRAGRGAAAEKNNSYPERLI